MKVAATRGKDESSCVLEEMELVMCRSCLQRSKDVIFEGFSSEGSIMEMENDEEDDEEGEESVERSWSI